MYCCQTLLQNSNLRRFSLAPSTAEALLRSDGLRSPSELHVLAAVLDWAAAAPPPAPAAAGSMTKQSEAAEGSVANQSKVGAGSVGEPSELREHVQQQRVPRASADVRRVLEAVRWGLIPVAARNAIAAAADSSDSDLEFGSVKEPKAGGGGTAAGAVLAPARRRAVLRAARETVAKLVAAAAAGCGSTPGRRAPWGWDAARARLRATLSGRNFCYFPVSAATSLRP
jgi:hypothetical protein